MRGGDNTAPDRTYIFLLPYRARSPNEVRRQEIMNALDSITSYFPAKKIPYTVIVVEQNNDDPFNKGLILNAGFIESEKYNTMPRIYVHMNVDYILDTSREFPQELNDFTKGFIEIYNMNLDNNLPVTYIGGGCAFDPDSYKRVNGFPNDIWGWGGEDNALRERVLRRGVPHTVNSLANNGWMKAQNSSAPRNTSKVDDNQKKAFNITDTTGIDGCDYTIDGAGEFNDDRKGIRHVLINFKYTT
jgi:hypothetical protein